MDSVLSLDEKENIMITLKSTDGISYTLLKDWVCISEMIKTSLFDEKEDTTIQINLKSEILGLIIEYMRLRKGEELQILNMKEDNQTNYNFIRKKNFQTCKGGDNDIPKQEADFVRSFYRNRSLLYGVCEGANYLHIESLLHICCAVIACIMKRKKIEELKIIMDRSYIVPNDVDEEND